VIDGHRELPRQHACGGLKVADGCGSSSADRPQDFGKSFHRARGPFAVAFI
jgi:hypothetical protein